MRGDSVGFSDGAIEAKYQVSICKGEYPMTVRIRHVELCNEGIHLESEMNRGYTLTVVGCDAHVFYTKGESESSLEKRL